MDTPSRIKFGYITLWAKGALAKMLAEFDQQEGIALSGSFDIKADTVDDFAEYLKALPANDVGYVRVDASMFFADELKPGDFKGCLQEPYKKPAATPAATRQPRSL